MIPGIKVDEGFRFLPRTGSVEPLCTGLDNPAERATDYQACGARFAKWRTVLQIASNGCLSESSICENA
ncbi:hypothetical protein CREGCYN_13280 [Synechococcus sp. M16CYN]